MLLMCPASGGAARTYPLRSARCPTLSFHAPYPCPALACSSGCMPAASGPLRAGCSGRQRAQAMAAAGRAWDGGNGASGRGRGRGGRGTSSKGTVGGRGEEHGGGGLSPRLLNSHIQSCPDIGSLAQLVLLHSNSFDYIHVATAWVTASRLRLGRGSDPDVNSCIQLLSAAAMPRLRLCKARQLANIAHSIAALAGPGGSYDAQFFTQLLAAARPQLSTFNPQDLSNTLLAMAKLGHHDPQFVDQLLVRATATLPAFNEQALSNTLYALAKLRHHCPHFTTDLLQEARRTLPGFNPQNLANLAYALASLNHQDVGFMEVFLPHMYGAAVDMNEQEVTNTLHALCILDHDAAAAVTPALSAAIDVLLPASKQPAAEALRQAYQYLITRERAGDVSARHRADPRYQQLRDACKSAWAEQLRLTAPRPASSARQEVVEAVRMLPGCEQALFDHFTEDRILHIDVAVYLSCGTKVAVEVDYAEDFMSNAPDLPLGPKVWRRRMLHAEGWVVVSVPPGAWSSTGGRGAVTQRQAFLLERFKAAGVQLPAEPQP